MVFRFVSSDKGKIHFQLLCVTVSGVARPTLLLLSLHPSSMLLHPQVRQLIRHFICIQSHMRRDPHPLCGGLVLLE